MRGAYGEPWSEGPNGRIFHCEGHLILDNEGYYEADMSRIVACVNAMDGVKNPAALRAQRDELLELVKSVHAWIHGITGGCAYSRSLAATIAKAEGRE